MGRHRRSAADRAATGRATGVTETQDFSTESHSPPDSYPGDHPTAGVPPCRKVEGQADADARSDAYLFASEEDYAAYRSEGFAPDDGARHAGSRRRKKRGATPVKTGLLGVSAAVALGTVAVATGVVPGLQSYKFGGGGSNAERVQAAASPTNSATEQGGTSGSVESREDDASTSRDAERFASPSPSPSTSSATPTKTPTKTTNTTKTPTKTPSTTPKATPSEKPATTPPRSRAAAKAPEQTSAPVTVSAESAAEAEVLKLVNQERAKVGCSAVAANSSLADLAQAFSEDMAERGFFDHTDPAGRSPWDRAAKAGITDLGGENIARGQAGAAAVMEAWMNSPGHKANILNCDFKTLGVGVHFGSGGPWWTQDFGY